VRAGQPGLGDAPEPDAYLDRAHRAFLEQVLENLPEP